MKTKEYVKKYKLSEGPKFDHSQFVADLTIDFMSLLEVGRSAENIKGFENSVRAIRMKWDAINNKTVGQLPEKLWKYFYASTIMKMKNELFPEILKEREKAREQRNKQREWERRELGGGFEDWYNARLYEFLLQFSLSNTVPSSSFVVLGIESNSSIEEIKAAYRKLSLIYHPDKGGNAAKFIEITEAKNKCLAYAKT